MQTLTLRQANRDMFGQKTIQKTILMVSIECRQVANVSLELGTM